MLQSWLDVRLEERFLKRWSVLRNGVLLLYKEPQEERPQHIYPLQSASLSFPSNTQLIVHLRLAKCQVEIVGNTDLLTEWHSYISQGIKQWKSKRRLAVLFHNRMRFSQSTNLGIVSEYSVDNTNNCDLSKEKKQWCSSMERLESVHRLREFSLTPEEERCAWASLPEVINNRFSDGLSEEELASSELMFSLLVSEVVYNQELARLVDLARVSVRWKDLLPTFNRRSIINCSLKVKKCSDSLVRRLEQEWSGPKSLVKDLSRIFTLMEDNFTAATAQTYVSYCDNLDDARLLFRRATERDNVTMSSVVSCRCHIELALLPIQRLSQLRTSLETIRRVLQSSGSSQQLLQCQQLYVTVTGIVDLCYKVLTSLHGASYIADVDNLLDFSHKLSAVRLKRRSTVSTKTTELVEEGNIYSATPTNTIKPGCDVQVLTYLERSFNLIDFSSLENLLMETRVDVESGPSSSSSGMSSLGAEGEYELIEMKEVTSRRWSSDSHLLQKSFEDQPLYQAYNESNKSVLGADLDTCPQANSIFYAYLDDSGTTPATEHVYEDLNDSVRASPLQPLRTLWCETDEVINSGILDKLTPSQIALQESKFEILTSEVSYLKSLNILITMFVESSDLKEVISCDDRRNLFSNILEVRKASEMFLFDLAGQWEEDFMLPDVCSVIHKHTQGSFRVYIEYCGNQVRFHRTLQRLMLDSERFLPTLTVLEGLTECQGYSLQSFLMLPVQRVTRLPLLVQAVQRRLMSNSPEFTTCRNALTAVNQLVHECNEGVRQNEQTEQAEALNQILGSNTKEAEENKMNSAATSKPAKTKKKKQKWKMFSMAANSSSCDV